MRDEDKEQPTEELSEIRQLADRIDTLGGLLNKGDQGMEKSLSILWSDDIALVILDIIMPEMGGIQCLQGILEINPDAKVIISTGAKIEGERKEAIESGSRGLVSKPFQLQEMLKTVREALGNG